MIRKLGDSTLRLIGDPHFGRKFVNGVPLNRRGEREALQMQDFKKLLFELEGSKTVVIMGDIFDQFKVDNGILMEVYDVLVEASWKHQDVDFFILQGNHDTSRDKESFSSFDLLKLMLLHRENIVLVDTPTHHFTRDGQNALLMFPYDAFTKASELVEIEKAFLNSKVLAAFGHWDVEDFGNDHNLIPLKELAPITSYIFTGHIHTPSTFKVDAEGLRNPDGDITVEITGSMQPYTHAEDYEGNIYVTKTLEEYYEAVQKDPDAFINKALRLILKPNEEAPLNLNVLQLTLKHVTEEYEEETEVKMEVFSFKELFVSCMIENDVSEETYNVVWDKYQEKNKDAQEA